MKETCFSTFPSLFMLSMTESFLVSYKETSCICSTYVGMPIVYWKSLKLYSLETPLNEAFYNVGLGIKDGCKCVNGFIYTLR